MEVLVFIVMLSAGSLWLSHRLHLVYVHVVAREERNSGARAHIGPRCFLALDLVFVLALLLALEALAFDHADRELLYLPALGLTRFSALVALWLVLERGHLELFYQRLARRRGGEVAIATECARGPNRLGQAVLVSLALVPLLLELNGLDLAAAGLATTGLLFCTCFVLPQLGLVALALRRLQPLRRALARAD